MKEKKYLHRGGGLWTTRASTLAVSVNKALGKIEGIQIQTL
jgi:hypothetical protein